MLTDKYLLLEHEHPSGFDGVQRVYRFDDGHGLSLVNSAMLHDYDFAWEAAVLKNVHDDGTFDELDYDTELIDDVAVFLTDEAANKFIEIAASIFNKKKA